MTRSPSRRSRWALAVLAGVALAGPTAEAQVIRPSSVSVSASPVVPVAAIGVDAVITFGAPFPQSVRVLYRQTGGGAFTTLAAQPDPAQAGRFRVALPAADVTPRGLELFTEYTISGSTFTEPLDDAANNAIRVPVFVPRIRSAIAPGARQHRMITVPIQLLPGLGAQVGQDLGGDQPADVFVDDYGPVDPARWRIFRWDPQREAYLDTPTAVGPIRPGRGFWIISGSGGEFDVERGVSTGVDFDGSTPFNAPTLVDLAPGWNQIGSPFTYPIRWDGVSGATLVEAPVGYDGTGYRLNQSILAPWEGYFVFNPTAQPVRLRFGPTPEATGAGVSFPDALRASVGEGGGLFQIQALTEGSQDGQTYVGWSQEASDAIDRLDVRKPPAPAGVGVRLEDAGGAWASSIRSTRGSREWTVALDVAGVASAQVTLSVTALEGDARAVWYDLDRGVRLDAADGRVVVPISRGDQTRRLRLLLDRPDEGAASQLRAGPNPLRMGQAASVRLDLGASAWVTAEVFDALGRRVQQLHDGPLRSGASEWTWTPGALTPQAAGLYLVRVSVDGKVHTQSMSILR